MNLTSRLNPFTGVALVIGASSTLQFGNALATHLFPILGTWSTSFTRFFIASLILLALTRPKLHTWNRTQWTYGLGFGIVVGLMNGFFYTAISRIPLSTAVTIEFLGPLTLAAVLSRNSRDISWVLLALAGVSMLGLRTFLGLGSLDIIGVAAAFGAATFWAIYIVLGTRVGAHIPGTQGLAVALFIGALTLAPFGAPGATAVLFDARLLLLVIGTAVLSSLIPFTLEFMALKRIPNSTFSILMSLEPAIAAVAGIIVLNQKLSILGIIAIACVITASVGSTLSTMKKKSVIVDQG
ncbi:EamA family transporter [Corynebacterium felinum]|uniref:Inner membrane transporter RhtA n=1 Tax=Corynebacterium felinum TaxID=131318 RepID=A0ABU2B921_9CORY|nr:EamA family transporter [Corynebacterium felinum]MDF5820502.1 EamA family transporter [Corynebacterium felinum]MDR7354761.1 inner membrane transporter RhtA [Corynebacterium felinum]WJY94123.1 Threonine/homoserine exporter RhtA [Corynebacterium felinum]